MGLTDVTLPLMILSLSYFPLFTVMRSKAPLYRKDIAVMSKGRLAVTTSKRTIVTLLVGLALFAASSASAAMIDLNFNSLPSAQGWRYFTSIGTNEADVFSVDGVALHQNSFGIFDDPKYIWQGVVERTPFELQFRARLTAFEGPYPTEYSFSILFGAGNFLVYIGLGPGFIVIEENVTGVQTLFIDTSQFHDYRLLGDPVAGSYRFFVDGAEVLSRTIGHTTGDSNFLMIGDRLLGTSGSPAGAKADLSLFTLDYTNVAKQVVIDIKPGSDTNPINPKSKGVILVALLTTDTFDATTVDSTMVLFGATGTEAAPVHSALADVDGDGNVDMILHFETQDTGIQCGDTSASLTGETFDEQAIEGSDSIKTVGCK
jgi:hypothetical protein